MVKIANTVTDNKNIPYIKIGDTLNIPVDWIDSETGEGILIDSNVSIECVFLTSYGVEFLPDIIIDPDQLNRRGKFQIRLLSSITETILPCIITTDLKVIVNDQVRHSADFSFEVRRSITQ